MKILQVIGKILRAFWLPIERNTVFFVGLYVLGVVSAWLTVPHTPSGKLYDNLYLELFLDLYVLCALLCLLGVRKTSPQTTKEGSNLSQRTRKQKTPLRCRLVSILKFLLCVVFYAVAMADVYCFEKYGSSLSPSMLMLVGETDSREAGEFLSSVLQWGTLTSGVGWLLLIAVLHAAGSWLVRKSKHLPLQLLPLVQSFMGFLVLCLLVVCLTSSWKNKQALWRLMTLRTVGALENKMTRHEGGEQYLPIYRLAFSIRANQLAAKQVEQLVDAADKVTVDSCSYISPTIVLIIGESYNKHHAQLYGYYMPTTPRQLRRERSGQLVKFSDVVTTWNLTSFVFKHMFSTYVIGQEGDWCDYPLFPEVFKKAGYEVTFLTNQFLSKAKEAIYDFSGGFFLNNPQLSLAMFDHRNETTHPWDDGLLRDWDEQFSKSDSVEKPSLVIFHLLGQHMNYYSRYPRKQTHFTAADYEKHRPKMLGFRKKQLVWYDNATLYNDSIVDQICRRFEDKEAIVIYVPDHGEEIYEPGRFIICRNHSDDIDYPLAHYEYEIPFWVWCSKKYIAGHNDIFRQVRAAKNRPMMIDALPHMLMYLAGIHSKDYHSEYNILSPDYDTHRPRLLKGVVDYNTMPRDMTSKRTAGGPKQKKKETKEQSKK